MIRGRIQGIEDVIMMMVFSIYAQRISSSPPVDPRFVMLGTWSSLVVLTIEATMALIRQYLVTRQEKDDLHYSKTEQYNQTNLDAQFEVEVPEYQGREEGEEKVGGGVEGLEHGERVVQCMIVEIQETHCSKNRQS